MAKGVEIYSWRKPDGGWTFAMLYGTNREKTETEVRQSRCILTLDELETALSRLAKDEHVFWMEKDGWRMPHPAAEVVDRVSRVASRAGLSLHVDGRRENP